jgi:type II secretory pathway component HofQ
MDMRFRVDRLEGHTNIANVGSVPVVTTKEVQTRVKVRDRETLMLGGVTMWKAAPSRDTLRFPKDLPIPGARPAGKRVPSELVLLFRPTLLAK